MHLLKVPDLGHFTDLLLCCKKGKEIKVKKKEGKKPSTGQDTNPHSFERVTPSWVAT